MVEKSALTVQQDEDEWKTSHGDFPGKESSLRLEVRGEVGGNDVQQKARRKMTRE